MPASKLQKCLDDEERHLRRLATYRAYRLRNLEDRRLKGKERMARKRELPSAVQRQAHREAQRRYKDSCAESIAHRARRATVRKNAAAGKTTKLRPKARHYYSDPELITDSEEEDDNDW
ncbi:hypothetical protein C8R46DRAFT_1044678 [Mycena filopes]|nr:hypothetical protein C8R46DRAFT_1044678 [Mycena filopes]